MPSLERFAAFADKYGTVSKTRATRATRATPAQGPQETAISTAPSIVAQAGDSQAIRATPEPNDSQMGIPVAHEIPRPRVNCP